MTIEQADDIAHRFLGWQCRLRQHAVRRSDGRPSQGMCPEIWLPDGTTLGTVTTVLVKREPHSAIAQFKHTVRRTHDPLERYEAAIRTLQTVYYQYPREFSDELTALFGPQAAIASQLIDAQQCRMQYEQGNQSFTLPAAIQLYEPGDPPYEATFWHNAMFNPHLQGPVTVLGFAVDWSEAIVETT